MVGIALNRIRYDPQSKVDQQHDYEMRRSYRSNTGSSCEKRVQVECSDSESKNGEVRDHVKVDIPEEEWCEQTDTNESGA